MDEYAVYDPEPDRIATDPGWLCEADVIGAYHGTTFTTPQGQVTGTLLRREAGTSTWKRAHP